MAVITTARLTMRRARMDDLPAIHAILSDPIGMRYWSTTPHEDEQQTADWLQSMVDADPASSDDFVVEFGGRVIGKCGCWLLPEIGFNFARDAWGQGLASEALAGFLDRRRAFDTPRRITADVDPRNHASLRLLERHGFVEISRAKGTWQVGAELCDSVYLALDL